MIAAATRALVRIALVSVTTSAFASDAPPPLPEPARAERVDPARLAGWRQDDHLAALRVFAGGCAAPPPLRGGVPVPAALSELCREAASLLAADPGADGSRDFFERRFGFWRIRPTPDRAGGFMTGYFEPEFAGATERSERFPTPLYRRPGDLVTRATEDEWPGLDPKLAAARRVGDRLEAFPDRAAIEDGALAGQGLEWLWLRDPVDRFVLQVQGSGRIRLPDGRVVRLVYSGRNGHPYTSLGRVLSEREKIPPAEMTMDRLVAWLKGDARFARDLIRENRSFVFFDRAPDLQHDAGPIGGAGLPLTALRSLAADRTIWPYGLPAWIAGDIPGEDGGLAPMARLGIVQDTGSAIVGPARIDLFVGSGAAAGHRAGLIRHPFDFVVLWPLGPTGR